MYFLKFEKMIIVYKEYIENIYIKFKWSINFVFNLVYDYDMNKIYFTKKFYFLAPH